MALDPGVRLGRYEIRGPLGAGGMAEVYLAEDTALGRRVALKLLPPDTAADEHARKRLLLEARAAATLDHPHICAVYDVGEADGRRFIAMQYVEGEPLDARLKRRSMDLGDAILIACEVADALAEAHGHGVIHRDIKPSNVMITARGQAVVLDFGLAKLFRENDLEAGETATVSALSAPGVVMGTLPYMSPEQVRGEPLDGRSDIFSLGVLLYQMLTGQRPFSGASAAATASAILTRDPAPLARFQPDTPAELERIVGKMLRKGLDERYQTAKDLLIDLRALRDEREFQRRLERHPSSVSGVDVAEAHRGTAAGPQTPTPSGGVAVAAPRRLHRAIVLLAAAVVVATFASWWLWRGANARWARAQLPQVQELAATRDYFAAYDLAAAMERYLPGDPTLERLLSEVAVTITARSEPAGAKVYLRRFDPDEAGGLPQRRLAGTTPVLDLRVARGEYVLSIEKDGYGPAERSVSGNFMRSGNLVVAPPPIVVDQTLIPFASSPARMVFVPGGEYRLVAWSRPTDERVRLDDYFIDKYEVTNREYKEFIDAGGYLKQQFWTHPFVRNGRSVPWEEAMRALVDRTGLPGPRTWASQNIPDGRPDLPVTDVTWYEAAAYAVFRDKQLPTVFQWEKAARNGARAGPVNFMPWGVFYPGETLAHHANFENNGPVPVGSMAFGMSPFGAHDMAGNVAEWTMNETSEGLLATGGAWGEPAYVFAQYAMLPGFFSSNKLGFRCALNSPGASGDQGGTRIEIVQEIPSYTASSAADFAKWRVPYRYDRAGLAAKVDDVLTTSEWRREKISFSGAGGKRATAYLYLPLHATRPLQVIHFVPAGDVNGGNRSLPASMEDRIAPFIKSGRAAFGVVLEGYMERLRPTSYVAPDPETVEFLEDIVSRVTDLRRGLDYLETRTDLDAERLIFFGPSAGAQLGLVLAAIETRYRAVVLQGAGLPKSYLRWTAAANPINFASHISGPTLMTHGLYDEDTPLRTAAEPLFKLLPEPKKMITYPGGHVPPVELSFSIVSAWLDQTVGPIRRE